MIQVGLLDRLVAEAAAEGVQVLVVGAIIEDRPRVLLLRRREDDFMDGFFELPGGGVEPNETLDQALVREVKEETGLDISAIGDYVGSFDYSSGSGRKSRQFNFVVQVAAAEPIILTEHDAYRWASPEDEHLGVSHAVRGILERYTELHAR